MIWECLKCLHVYNIELPSQFELSFFYVVYSFFMSRTLVTAAVTAAEFTLTGAKLQNLNFMPQTSGIKLRHLLTSLADYSFKQQNAKSNKIIGKHKIR